MFLIGGAMAMIIRAEIISQDPVTILYKFNVEKTETFELALKKISSK